jgi:hypothetical protein
MPSPRDVPELANPTESAADAADAARCLEEAARMVQDFAAAGAPAALAALLASAEDDPGASVEQMLGLARTVTEQAETLHGEVTRFLTTTNNT